MVLFSTLSRMCTLRDCRLLLISPSAVVPMGSRRVVLVRTKEFQSRFLLKKKSVFIYEYVARVEAITIVSQLTPKHRIPSDLQVFLKFDNVVYSPISTAPSNNGLGYLAEDILRLRFLGYNVFDDALDDSYLEVLEDSPLHHFALLASNCIRYSVLEIQRFILSYQQASAHVMESGYVV